MYIAVRDAGCESQHRAGSCRAQLLDDLLQRAMHSFGIGRRHFSEHRSRRIGGGSKVGVRSGNERNRPVTEAVAR
jgi:hypothetical protein